MIGRAGRNGCPARAHILSTVRKTKDPMLMALTASDKEYCRRRTILQGLGSPEDTVRNDICCDNCGGGRKLFPRLVFLGHVPVKRSKKRKPVRTVDVTMEQKLKDSLLDEMKKILFEEPGYQIMGCEVVISTSCTSQICELAPVITSKEDLSVLAALRPEYRDRIYHLVCETFTCPPPVQ